MQTFNFDKILGHKHTGSIFYNGNFYPYSVEYTGEDEDGDGSLFYVDFFGIQQHFLEEDLEEVFQNDVYDAIKYYLEQKQKESEQKKIAISVRLFEKDLNFLKQYAEKNHMQYQSLIRDFVTEKTQELQAKP